MVRRTEGNLVWVFVLNHTETPYRADPASLGLAPGAVDLLTDTAAEGMTVRGGGVAVLHGRLSP
ncbi:hypothetical protein GCM10009642_58140 [Nocardiopsis metallicus]